MIDYEDGFSVIIIDVTLVIQPLIQRGSFEEHRFAFP